MPPVLSRGTAFLATAGLLAAVLLLYSLQGIEWGQVWQVATRARLGQLGVCAILATIAMFLRAVRWRLLLIAEGRVTVLTAFWATAAGYFGNNFLPARAGELVRAYIVSSRGRLQRAYVLATALADRAVDAVVLVSVSSGVMWAFPVQPGWFGAAVRSSAALGMIGAVGIAVLPLLRSKATKAIGYLPVSDPLRVRIASSVEAGLRGVGSLHEGRRLSAFLALTVLIWGIDALGTILAAGALGLSMPISAALLLIAGLGLGSALPSTPGYIGIYQFVAVTVLEPFGYSRADAIAFILVAQALSFVVIGCWGGLGLWLFRWGSRSVKGVEQ